METLDLKFRDLNLFDDEIRQLIKDKSYKDDQIELKPNGGEKRKLQELRNVDEENLEQLNRQRSKIE